MFKDSTSKGNMKFKHVTSALLVLSGSNAFADVPPNTTASAQVTLSQDSFYQGALLDAKAQVTVYKTGAIQSGTLKSDYPISEVIFKMGSVVNFFRDGSISGGVLKNDATLMGVKFAANEQIYFHANGGVSTGVVRAGTVPNDANLVIPSDMQVTFDQNGYVQKTYSSVAYRLLDTNLVGTTEYTYDLRRKKYQLFVATISQPLIIAMLVTAVEISGSPRAFQPIIAPAGSNGTFLVNNPNYREMDERCDRWNTVGKFALNGYALGYAPSIWVNGSQLCRIVLTEPVFLDGRRFEIGESVFFNNNGKVILP